jgi:tetratricopeptide (TPR) repeat protein
MDIALEYYTYNVENNPGNAYSHAFLAKCHWKLGDEKLAHIHFNKAIGLDPQLDAFVKDTIKELQFK